VRRLADAAACAAFAAEALESSNVAGASDATDASFPEAAVVATQERLREALQLAASAQELLAILTRLAATATPVRAASQRTAAALQVCGSFTSHPPSLPRGEVEGVESVMGSNSCCHSCSAPSELTHTRGGWVLCFAGDAGGGAGGGERGGRGVGERERGGVCGGSLGGARPY
jgi:hypothetical protein